MSFNTGLYTLIKNNFTEFNGVDSQGNTFYKLFYIQSFNTIDPPYATFCRHGREHELDLKDRNVLFSDRMSMKIYHKDSLALENLQIKMRVFLESLFQTTVDTCYIQKIHVPDDYHQVFIDAEKGLLIFEGILEFEVDYQP